MQCAAVGSTVVVSNRGFGIGPLRSLRSKRGLVVVAGDPKDDPFHDPAVCPTKISNTEIDLLPNSENSFAVLGNLGLLGSKGKCLQSLNYFKGSFLYFPWKKQIKYRISVHTF